MYVHLGNNCVISSQDIIGIFSLKEDPGIMGYVKEMEQKGKKAVRLCSDENVFSCVVTRDNIYLSPISSVTVSKRTRFNTIKEPSDQ